MPFILLGRQGIAHFTKLQKKFRYLGYSISGKFPDFSYKYSSKSLQMLYLRKFRYLEKIIPLHTGYILRKSGLTDINWRSQNASSNFRQFLNQQKDCTMKDENKLSVPEEAIMSKIYLIRGQKVMLDKDLAELYEVRALRLREQVKRNIFRFPENFMFRLTEQEADFMVSQNAIPSKQHLGGHLPYAFTEHGVLMLANVLKSERAIKMSIRIIEVFIRIREMLLAQNDIILKLEKLEQQVVGHDDKIVLIFEYLHQLEQSRRQLPLLPLPHTGERKVRKIIY